MDFWGAPCRQDEHQVSSFYVKMRRFFFNFGTFLQEKSEPNTFDRNHRLKSSGQELKSKNSLARFKVTPITFGLYVSDFWMSSCKKPACPFFFFYWNKSCTLKASKWSILKSKLVLLLSDQLQEATADTLLTIILAGKGLLSSVSVSRDSKYS